MKYDIIDAAEDVCKEGYNFGVFVCSAFYEVSNISALKKSYDAYSISRFSQTIEAFQYEHEKLTYMQRKTFYEDLKYNEQNLAYLYSLFEKSRTSTFLIHMKILARLSKSLVENKRLNNCEGSLLANIQTLTENDFIKYKEIVGQDIEKESYIEYSSKNYEDVNSLYKFQNIGILAHARGVSVIFNDDEFGITFSIIKESREFYSLLKEIIDEQT